jgi:FixJ family two-component response regulator
MAEASRWIALVDDDTSVLNAPRRSLRVRALQTKTYGREKALSDLED